MLYKINQINMSENLKQTTDTNLQLREQIKANYEEINNPDSGKSEQELYDLEQETFAMQREVVSLEGNSRENTVSTEKTSESYFAKAQKGLRGLRNRFNSGVKAFKDQQQIEKNVTIKPGSSIIKGVKAFAASEQNEDTAIAKVLTKEERHHLIFDKPKSEWTKEDYLSIYTLEQANRHASNHFKYIKNPIERKNEKAEYLADPIVYMLKLEVESENESQEYELKREGEINQIEKELSQIIDTLKPDQYIELYNHDRQGGSYPFNSALRITGQDDNGKPLEIWGWFSHSLDKI
jgi:hypothetical protein